MLPHPMILHPVIWYLIITLLGWLTFPLAYHLLPALADRGYAISRALGWLLWGYLFWLLASLGVVGNNDGGLLFSLLLLVGLSAWALRKITFAQIAEWWQSQRRLIIYVELLFLVSFAAIAVIRAANPEILGTEKPMELAFINAILNSPTFPPHDPWLSGYAISYYYFGYVLVAMLAKIAGTPGGIAFNSKYFYGVRPECDRRIWARLQHAGRPAAQDRPADTRYAQPLALISRTGVYIAGWQPGGSAARPAHPRPVLEQERCWGAGFWILEVGRYPGPEPAACRTFRLGAVQVLVVVACIARAAGL